MKFLLKRFWIKLNQIIFFRYSVWISKRNMLIDSKSINAKILINQVMINSDVDYWWPWTSYVSNYIYCNVFISCAMHIYSAHVLRFTEHGICLRLACARKWCNRKQKHPVREVLSVNYIRFNHHSNEMIVANEA